MFSRVPEEVCEVRLIDLAAAEKAHCMIPKVEYPQCRRPRMLQAPKKPCQAGPAAGCRMEQVEAAAPILPRQRSWRKPANVNRKHLGTVAVAAGD